MLKTRIFANCISLSLLFTLSIAQANDEAVLKQLQELSMEELMNLEVTIAGKTPQKVSDVSAAVYVVTKEDIKKLGANSIPEALRLVPGMHVARIDANKWAISSRGFNDLFANNLLVMIDGRTIYNQLLAGTYWDDQDILMDDIERIEVIRGPGATVWGANAVNGVINIITKHTTDTQGTYASTTLGSELGIVALRQGGEISNTASYRLYAKYHDQDNGKYPGGLQGADSWDDARAGFRLDLEPDQYNQITIDGGFAKGERGSNVELFTPAFPFSRFANVNDETWTSHLRTSWTKTNQQGTTQELQVYYDYTARDGWLADAAWGTFDINYQYHFASSGRHDVIIGAGYRLGHDKIPAGSLTENRGILTSERRTTDLFSAFIQNDITLIDEKVWLTLGSKFEQNDFSGFEIQPSVRIRWRAAENQLVWGSLSRAVRTPFRALEDLKFTFEGTVPNTIPNPLLPPRLPLLVAGDPNSESTELLATELGYRLQANERLNIDLSFYYNKYKNVQSFGSFSFITPTETAPVPAIAVGLSNDVSATTYGAELAIDWLPLDQWKIRSSYAYMHTSASGTATSATELVGENIDHQISILSSFDLTPKLSLNNFVRFVDGNKTQKLDEYVEIDAGLQWQATRSLTISLYGKNLLDKAHKEYEQINFGPRFTEVEREVFVTVAWQF